MSDWGIKVLVLGAVIVELQAEASQIELHM